MSEDIFYETLGCSRDKFFEELVIAVRNKLNNDIPYGYILAPNGELVPNIQQQRVIRKERELKDQGHTFEKINEILADEVIFTQEEMDSYRERNPYPVLLIDKTRTMIPKIRSISYKRVGAPLLRISASSIHPGSRA
jgi:hypothetical protein